MFRGVVEVRRAVWEAVTSKRRLRFVVEYARTKTVIVGVPRDIECLCDCEFVRVECDDGVVEAIALIAVRDLSIAPAPPR